MPVTVVVRAGTQSSLFAKGANEPSTDPSLTFDGTRIVIGRSNGSDVRLPDPSVSLRHASIRAQGAEYALVDEGSTNGTWVGGVKLGPHTPRIVKTGDLVRIGRVWLEMIVGQRAPTPDLGLATRDLALALVRGAMDAVGDDTQVKVRVAEGPDLGAVVHLSEEGRPYILGRAEKCDLPLADEDASREHASIVRRGIQVVVRDLTSRNGVYLGDARIEPAREVVWRPPTMIRIGVSVLALDEPVSKALADLEAAADERLADGDAPPAPASIASPPASAPPSVIVAPTSAGPKSAPRSGAPESRLAPEHEAPIAEVAARNATTVARGRPRRVWTAIDILVVTIAIAVIGASIAGLVWVLRSN